MIKSILKNIEQCDDFHNRCDYLLEHDESTRLIEYITELEKENSRLKESLKNASSNYTKYIQERYNKIDKIKSFIITNKPIYINQKGKPCIIDVTNDLLEMLKGDSGIDD